MRDIFPPNVHVFKTEEPERVSLASVPVDVYGFGFTSREMTAVPVRSRNVEDKERINILLCHADMTSRTSTTCPLTPEDIDAFGADYTALGHIHNVSSAETGHDGRWCYCGCLEGRSFDETGPKGACIVQINKVGEESDITIKRVRFSKRKYEKCELDITGASSNSDISAMIEDCIASRRYGDDTLLSLSLTGKLFSGAYCRHGRFVVALIRTVYAESEPDETSLLLDEESLSRDLSIKGEIYRTLLPKLNSDDARERDVASRALRYALSALSGENIL